MFSKHDTVSENITTTTLDLIQLFDITNYTIYSMV